MIDEESSVGRPRSGSLYKDALKSIIPIVGKYDLDPKLFVDVFVEALRNKKSRYENIEVRCRGVNKDSAIFLITEGEKVVSQFPLSLEALNNPELFKNHIQHIPKSTSKKVNVQKQMKIGELRSGMRRIDVKAKILEVPPRKLVYMRWGGQSYVSNIKIADETGSIRLSLWNTQIDRIHVGNEIEIENGYVAIYAGEPQLRLGKKGKLSVV